MKRFPEVTQVVGKLGRAESATDPAPIGMFETIINLDDPENWPRRVIKRDKASDLVDQIAHRLVAEGVITEPQAVMPEPSDVVHDVVSRLDELAVKYQIHEGVIQRVHIDGHEIIDGESLRKAMTAT